MSEAKELPLRVLQVSPSDVGGGAERVAADLHLGLLEREQHSWIALGADHGRLPNVVQIPNNAHRSPWARSLLRAAGLFDPAHERPLPAGLRRLARFAAEPARFTSVMRGNEDFDFPGTRYLPDLVPDSPQVINLHNLHGSYFDIRCLPLLATRAPLILTMHDTWLLTGHCAYPMQCEGWKTGCLSCPHPEVYVPIRGDAARRNYQVKTDSVRAAGIRIATPSRWLMDMVERSEIASSLVETKVIPNGVDTSVFQPGDRQAARHSLGIADDAVVVMSAARSASASDFKGFDVLEAALRLFGQSPLAQRTLVLVVGQERPDERIGGIPVRSVPFVEDRAQLASYYRAADVYVHPARAESFGLAVLEAMACGAPVVASREGGIPEIVEDGVSGILVRVGDAEGFTAGIAELASNTARAQSMGAAGVTRAAELTLDRQVDTYLGWYRQIVASASR